MKLISIQPERWLMDGGAVFGVVPKAIWQKLYAEDRDNLLPMVSRCLLIDWGERKILIDTGMGRKQSQKYYQYKYLDQERNIKSELERNGYDAGQITDVILTHLHDDHAGGVTYYDNNQKLRLQFPNATHYVSREQYAWALDPNPREKAAYFDENIVPVMQANKLHLLERNEAFPVPFIDLLYVDGHTRGQIIPLIHHPNASLVFVADFIPTTAHIPVPYVAAVDIEPLKTLKEKQAFLNEAFQKKYMFFFEHDNYTEICSLKQTAKGIRADQSLRLNQSFAD
ncbi:MAG: MBL fold metallo-hydrolase [Bacteroidota bacterium]